jgi:hypothetical protein
MNAMAPLHSDIDPFTRGVGVLQAASPAAPALLVHILAHLMSDSTTTPATLRAFGRAITRSAQSLGPTLADLPALLTIAGSACCAAANRELP